MTTQDAAALIAKLKRNYQCGVITKAEYEAKAAEVLAQVK